jgi:flagellar motor switch protein FliM
MGDILSQNEIDELLKNLNIGEIENKQEDKSSELPNHIKGKNIKIHDFRRPSKFAKDQLKTLNIIHDNYARLVTNFLTGYLRTLVQVDVINVETLAYMDFNSSIVNPTVLAYIDFNPLPGIMILEISPVIAFTLIDRILGGKGSSIEKPREFTEIEFAIIERIINQMLNIMKEPWGNVVMVKPHLEKIETNPQFAQIISPNEMIALVKISVKVGDVDGLVNICIPHIIVEPVVSKLTTKFWFSTKEKEKSDDARKIIERKIEQTKVTVKAILGETSIVVNDLIELQTGDVIPLNTGVNKDIQVMVGDLLKFNGKPGVHKNRVAIRITKVLRRED